MIVPPQTLLQTVLQTTVFQSQQYQTQQYGNARIIKPVEVPTNYTRTTCCDVLPQSEETYYCYVVPPYFATCNIYYCHL
jgi:hypothetical protein